MILIMIAFIMVKIIFDRIKLSVMNFETICNSLNFAKLQLNVQQMCQLKGYLQQM